MAEPNNRGKKKSSGGAWGLIILAVIWGINRIDSEKLSRLFRRLRWSFRTGKFDMNDKAVVGTVAAVVVLVVLIAALSSAVKKMKEKRFEGVKARRGGTAAAHSHDRIQGYAGNESAGEHWKKQLAGFLAAGISDRSEYRVRLERRLK